MAQTPEQRAAYKKQWYEKNKTRIAEQAKEFRSKNKEKLAAKAKAYYEANKEERAEYYRQWAHENRKKAAAYKAQWYQENKRKNPEKVRQQSREVAKRYYHAHKDEVQRKTKEWKKKNQEWLRTYSRIQYWKHRDKRIASNHIRYAKKKYGEFADVLKILMDLELELTQEAKKHGEEKKRRAYGGEP